VLESGQKKEDIGNGQKHLSTGTNRRKIKRSRSALKQGANHISHSPADGNRLTKFIGVDEEVLRAIREIDSCCELIPIHLCPSVLFTELHQLTQFLGRIFRICLFLVVKIDLPPGLCA
jgi:hypothetical protein